MLALRDNKGNTVCRIRAVKAILASWSPVLRGALEIGNNSTHNADLPTHSTLHSSSSSGCLTTYGSTNCSIIPSAAAANNGTTVLASIPDCTATLCGAGASGVTSPAVTCSSSVLGVELPILVDGHKEVEAWKVAVCLMHPLDPTCGKTPSSLITTCVIKSLVTLADKYNIQVSFRIPYVLVGLM